MSEPKPTAVAEPPATDPAPPDEIEVATQAGVWVWLRTPVLIFAGITSVLVSVTAVWGLNFIKTVGDFQDLLPKEQTASIDPWDGVEPRNVLVLGSDSRAGLSEEDQAAFGTEDTVGGQRTDTIILLSIDPDREQAVVVHFPRDLRVEIPGHGTNKINAAYEFGGPDLVIRTVQQFTGLEVNNYMDIDLAGFQKLVDTLGGVKVCVDRPMIDPLAGLNLPKEGCYLMDGAQALGFVRARNIEGDVIPDFSRIRRQQQFMRAMMNRLLSIDSLLNDAVIREAVGAVRTDSSLNATELIDLGRKLRQLAQEDPTGAESLDLRVVPGTTQTIGDVSYVVADPEAQRLFDRLDAGRPLGQLGQDLALTAPAPGIIKVRVMPLGTSDPAEAQSLLRRGGFIVMPTEAAPVDAEVSEIIFKHGDEDRALVVSGFFPGMPMREVPSDVLGEAEVGVIVGDDFSSILSRPESEGEAP